VTGLPDSSGPCEPGRGAEPVSGPAPRPEASPASPAPAAQQWTVLDVIRWTAARFGERGLATPRLDAELIVAQILGLPRIQLYVQSDRPLSVTELGDIRALIKRRQAGESVAYLVGKKEFWGLELAVDARVLVPRPDTETLIEEALARLEGVEAPRLADVGTGSGALAVTLAKLRPDAVVFASDISAGALEVARANAERLGVAVTFLEGDLAAPLLPHAPFRLIVANLPYIPFADLAGLPPEVRAEPALALDGGADGLDLVRELIAAAPALLAVGGALALEIGAGQAAATSRLLADAGLVEIAVRPDLAGVERVVTGVRP
jgi:release factor glutamine methyltransferase